MIATRNYVDSDGQTVFSGDRIPPQLLHNGYAPYDVCLRIQSPMTWLSEHQTNLRIEKELSQEHILSQHKSSPI